MLCWLISINGHGATTNHNQTQEDTTDTIHEDIKNKPGLDDAWQPLNARDRPFSQRPPGHKYCSYGLGGS